MPARDPRLEGRNELCVRNRDRRAISAGRPSPKYEFVFDYMRDKLHGRLAPVGFTKM